MTSQAPVLCIVGPTASGKSDIAQELSLHIGGQIISADSMQIYSGMDIGTGKVPRDKRKVKHYGLDLVYPGQAYSVALYQEYARTAIQRIRAEGSCPVLCGGTGFYVRAVIDDYRFPAGEQVDNTVRDTWNAYAVEQGSQALWEQLDKRDPESAAVIHPNNVKRVVRALELFDLGLSYAAQLKQLQEIPQVIDAYFFGLQVTPSLLRKRIADRVDTMFSQGLIDEVSHLLESGFRDALTAAEAIGYKEIVSYLEHKCTLEQAREDIIHATCKYAKRQRTWFRKDKRISWIDADNYDSKLLSQQIATLLIDKSEYFRERLL